VDALSGQLHEELNHNQRRSKIKAIQSLLRSLERAGDMVNAEDNQALSADAMLKKQMTLARIDRVLDQILAALELV